MGSERNPNSLFVKQTLPGYNMVTFWSWMVVVKITIFTVRNPCRGERVNITFRWIRNHVPRCRLAAGVVCCLPTCAKGSLVSSNTDSFLPGFLLLVVLFACWVGGIPLWLPSSHFVLNCGASLVDAVPDRTMGVSNSLGFICGFSLVGWLLWMRTTLVWKGLPSLLNKNTYFVFWPEGQNL